MLKMIRCCDVCGNPLPTKMIETPFGVFESVQTFKAEEWDISCVAPDLCELCALKIDKSVVDLRRKFLKG